MRALIFPVMALLLVTVAQANEQSLVTRSAGKLHADQSVDLSAKLQAQDWMVRAPATKSEDSASQPIVTGLESFGAHPSQYVEIYDAEVNLESDLDGDGYHHRLSVLFDVDVFYGDADVYAKIFLSSDAGPWTQVFTTDLFLIVDDSAADTYEVVTELVEGYQPAYYSVLIEIYSLSYPGMVTSAIVDFDAAGRLLRLEDLSWDDPYPFAYSETYTEISYSSGGGSAPLLPLLLGLLVIAARGRKKSLSPLSND